MPKAPMNVPADDVPDVEARPAPKRRVGPRFLLSHPAHFLALGGGSGLSPIAPGTAGTLWAWVAFAVLNVWLDSAGWGWMRAR